MKKVLIFLISLVFIPVNVQAATGSVRLSCPSAVAPNESFTCGITGNTPDGTMSGFQSTLSMSEGISCSGVSSDVFTGNLNSNSLLLELKTNPVPSGSMIGTLSCLAGDGSSNKTIALTSNKMGVEVSGETQKVTAPNVSSTIRIKSTDNNLSSLSIVGATISPAFDPATLSYNATIDAASVTLNVAKSNSYATIKSNGAIITSGVITRNLIYGENNISIVVISETGVQKIYDVKITRPDNRSTNNYLSNLTVSYGSINFNKNTPSYEVNLPGTESTFSIAGTKEDHNANITYSPAQSVTLNYGETKTINIIVTAENGLKRIYYVEVTRPDNRSKENSLKNLVVANTDIKYDGRTSYTAVVDYKVTSIKIDGTTKDSAANVTGFGNYTLNVGSNKFSVIVIAENGDQKVYTITVIRKNEEGKIANLSDNNNLSSLTIDGMQFAFEKNTLVYNIGADYSVENLLINYITEDDKATVVIEGNKKLEVGQNKINIIVTSESGKNKTYVLVITRAAQVTVTKNTKDDILKALDGDENIITIEIKNSKQSKIIDSAILKKLREKRKKIIYEVQNENGGLLYEIVIDGAKLKNTNSTDINLLFNSLNEEKIKKQVGEESPFYIRFNKKIPSGSELKVYVGDAYKDGTILNLYSYIIDSNELEYVKELKVIDGYVTFEVNGLSEYILLKSQIIKNRTSFIVAIFIILLLIAGAVSYLIIANNKKKKIQVDTIEEIQE